jgi:DNA-binding MarR family transcriptional regulator
VNGSTTEENDPGGGGEREAYSPEFLVELLRRLSVTSARHVSMIAKTMGVSFTEVVALHHLYDTGGLTSKELARLMFLTPGAVTQLADRLERAGYLERAPNPADRRSLLLRETRVGEEAALKSLDPFMREARVSISALSGEERELVGRFLAEVMRAMNPPADDG